MTVTVADTRTGTCWDCGGPCLSYKGSLHGWRCRACIATYLDADAAKAAAAEERGREKRAARFRAADFPTGDDGCGGGGSGFGPHRHQNQERQEPNRP